MGSRLPPSQELCPNSPYILQVTYLIYLTAPMASMFDQEKGVGMDQTILGDSTSRTNVWHHKLRNNFKGRPHRCTKLIMHLKQGIKGSSLLYHLKTVYLITKSDIKTTILPATTFAISGALSGALLTTASSPSFQHVLSRMPDAVLWTWLNLWIFNLANQRLPNSVLEDSINKPWRAIPSNRLTPTHARQLLLFSIPVVLAASFYLGGLRESVALMVLTWIYNDLGAADEHYLVRHVNNALGFIAFSAGATQVACGFPQHGLNDTAYQWLAMIGAVITFTIQFQDMEDQEGDRLRNRRTMPLVIGDYVTRWANAVTVVLFSVGCPAFWQLGMIGFAVPVFLGTVIAIRTMTLKDVAADKRTFQLWCLWLITLYLLPLVKSHTASNGLASFTG